MLRQLSRWRASYCRRVNTEEKTEADGGDEVAVPKGYVPVMVGREKDHSAKFLIHIDMFKNECFAGLLQMVAEEVGYQNPGILRIPCDAECFGKLLNEITRIY